MASERNLLAKDRDWIQAADQFGDSEHFPNSQLYNNAAINSKAAIVGVSCRLPQADNPQELWDMLVEQRDGITFATDERHKALEWSSHHIAQSKKCGHDRGGFLKNIDKFDPSVFGMSYRETSAADPQQRLLLEVGWEAFENACMAPDRLAGSKTGVFVGIGNFDYILYQAALDPDSNFITPYSAPGAAHSIAANRISYLLDLQGPSLAIDTACSSSFYALHAALRSMKLGECDAALVCGVNAILSPFISKAFLKARMLSPDGLCKVFDSTANGYVRAEGCVAIIIKPLERALNDGDRIMGVISGSAINHDGKTVGMVAPNGDMQVKAIQSAMECADVTPDMIGYVEAHGTGTQLGDTIELDALSKVFKGDRSDPCFVGSIKSNVGHLEPVSGLAGLLKTLLCIENEEIPGQAHLETPIEAATADGSRIVIPKSNTPWVAGDVKRIAGVSSFGFGGANSHILVEEPPKVKTHTGVASRPAQILKLSAKKPEQLTEAAERLCATLEENPDYRLEDICHSANIGRADFSERVVVSANSRKELAEGLAAISKGATSAHVSRGHAKKGKRRIAFLFTGQGAQYSGMGRELYSTEPGFRHVLDEADEITRSYADFSLCDLLYNEADSNRDIINQTQYTQPALYAVEYALAKLWISWGLEPEFLLGHSIGEYVAATVDKVLSFEDALRLVIKRGQLMASTSSLGAMAFTGASPEVVEKLLDGLGDQISIAAINGPSSTVVSGAKADIERFEVRATDAGHAVRRLDVSHAFHSPLMDKIVKEFALEASRYSFGKPSDAFISNVTGKGFDNSQNIDGAYWADHIRQAVRFWDGVQTIAGAGADMFIEVGPHSALLPGIRTALSDKSLSFASTLSKNKSDWDSINFGIGQLYKAGADINWGAIDRPFGYRKLALPNYPFARKRFWYTDDGKDEESLASAAMGQGFSNLQVSSSKIGDDLTAIYPVNDARKINELAAQHVIRGSAIFPATGYLALLLQPLKDQISEGLQLTNVAFLKALSCREDVLPLLTVSIVQQKDDQWFSMVRSLEADGGNLRPLANAEIRKYDSRPSLKGQTSYFKDWDTEQSLNIVPDLLYSQLDEAGMAYGADFQCVKNLFVKENAACAEVECNEILADQWKTLDPAALDACLHPIATLVGQSEPGAANSAWVPVAIDRLRLYGAQPEKLRSFVRQRNSLQTGALQSFDVVVTDNQDNLWLEIDGLWLQRMAGMSRKDVPIHAIRWLKEDTQRSDAKSADISWDYIPVGVEPDDPVLLHLRGRGMEKADLAATPVSELPDSSKSNGVDHSAFNSIEVERSNARSGGKEGETNGLIVVVGQHDDDPASWSSCSQFMHMMQTVATRKDIDRVVVVTSGASGLVPGEKGFDPRQAMIWGFCRSLQWEKPQWGLYLIDVPMHPGESDLEALSGEIIHEAGPNQIAIKDGQRYVPRLVPELRASSKNPPSLLPKTFRLDAPGSTGPQSVRAVPAEIIEPGPGQVKIRTSAMGLNFRDVMKSLGIYPASLDTPFWLGDECSGTIETVGEGVTEFVPGDEVIAIAPAAFASQTVTDVRMVVAKPSSISFEAAATLPIVYTTAWHSLVNFAKLQPGETVLIHAAAGGVGLAAIQIAQHIGAKVIASAGTPEKRAYLAEQGVSHIIDSSTPEFGPEVLAATDGAGVDVVLNSLAGPYIETSLGLLKYGGRFVEIGKRDFFEDTQIGLRPFHKGLSYFAVDMERFFVDARDEGQVLLNTVIGKIAAGALKPPRYQTMPIEDAAQGFQRLLRREVIGKVVFTNPEADVQAQAAARDAYLVTGGLGSLGLVIAKWLVGLGAGHILLASRRAPSPEVKAKIQELSASGCVVEAVKLDASDFSALKSCIDNLDEEGLRFKGIVHAAGVLDDKTLPNLNDDALDRVMSPKVRAAWNLHVLSCDRELDLFICFSSISSIIGSPGQANYAAANAYLDALCRFRRSLGLPGKSVNWGPWQIGMVEDEGVRVRFEQMGFNLISEEAGISALNRFLEIDEGDVFAADMDWTKFISSSGQRGSLQILSEIAPTDSQEKGLSSATASLDREEVFELLKSHVVDVTSIPASEIEEDTVFAEIGFDSIVGLELLLRLENSLGVMPSPDLLSEDMTLGDMIAALQQTLEESGGVRLAVGEEQDAKSSTSEVVVSQDNQAKVTSEVVAASSETNESDPEKIESGQIVNGVLINGATSNSSDPTDIQGHSIEQVFKTIRDSLDPESYLSAIRPDFTSALHETKLDIDYDWGRGDLLKGRRGSDSLEVIDMLGGFGSTLFGHNHPALVRVFKDALQAQRPQFVQMSNRTAAGALAEQLGDRLGQETGDKYVTVLGSTGGEIVDAALKHALFEWAVKREESLKTQTLDQTTNPGQPPVVLAIEGSYHGKTLGAYSLTWNAPGRDELGLKGPFEVVWLKRDDEAHVREVFAEYAASGTRDESTGAASRIAGVFVEPIQGEAGIFPLSEQFLSVLRQCADVAGCPIIVDEIQSGMGRCGAFAASSTLNLIGDYYLFGKSLGGGLAKVAALLVNEARYQAGFGFVHTSTFAEDDHGCLLGLQALKLFEEDNIPVRSHEAGQYLCDRLADLRSQFPDVLADVRGCGLMAGVELADQSNNGSILLSGLQKQGLLGVVVASHLLHRHGVRVGTALGRSSTLRLEPSAYISREHLDHVVQALAAVCEKIQRGDAAQILHHLAQGDTTTGLSQFRVHREGAKSDQRNGHIKEDQRPRVVFLGHMIDADSIGSFDPSLMSLSSDEREFLAQRIPDPIFVTRFPITSIDGEKIDFEIHSLGLTSAVIEKSIRTGDSSRVVKLVDQAVSNFAMAGVQAVGLGGLLSVVTRNGLAVAGNNPSIQLTTGNTYTVALAGKAVEQASEECGLDRDGIRLGVVGAGGNIGSTLVQILSEKFQKFHLIGRQASLGRVEKTAEKVYLDAFNRLRTSNGKPLEGLSSALAETKIVREIESSFGNSERDVNIGKHIRQALIERYGEDPFITISPRIEDLTDSSVIVSASNSVTPIFNADNVGPAVRVLCDISVPSDVDPSVAAARPDIVIVRGGVAYAAGDNDFLVERTGLPQNHLLACMAETAILGLAGRSDYTTIGEIDPESVRKCAKLGMQYGFGLGYITFDKLFSLDQSLQRTTQKRSGVVQQEQ